ncbi:MAG: DUF5606 domain-containing protein [Bacteroidota bacterium]
MNLERILAISGKPGLYALKMQTRTGFVAESLMDGKKITVSLRSNVSLLSEISMYTYSEEKPLAEVMVAIAKKENNGQAPNFKDDKAQMTAYFVEVLSDYDQERVYASDIKKVLNWYNILQAKGLTSTEVEAKTEATTEKALVGAEAKSVKTPKAAAPKNAGAAAAKKAPAQKATKSTKK